MPAKRLIAWVAAALAALTIAGCQQDSPQVVKIGLVAPFEGRYREIGVDVIPAARLAIREWAEQHPNSPIVFELVAYDDAGDPDQAIEQARKLRADSTVAIVIGHWRDDTTAAALPLYAEAGIPLVTYSERDLTSTVALYNLAPSASRIRTAVEAWIADAEFPPTTLLFPLQVSLTEAAEQLEQSSSRFIGDSSWGLNQYYTLTAGATDGNYFVSGYSLSNHASDSYWTVERIQSFEAGFREGSLDAPPGLYSIAAYEAAWVALNTLSATYGIDSELPNAASQISFDTNNRRVDAPIYLYQWVDGARQLVTELD